MDDIEDIYELSPTQQGMLFHTLYAAEPGVYFDRYAMTLRGKLDLQALNARGGRLSNVTKFCAPLFIGKKSRNL